MNLEWMKPLRRKPDRSEKIKFGILLTAIGLMTLRSCVWADIQEIDSVKEQIDEAKQQKPVMAPPKASRSTPPKKNWVGSVAAVKDAAETALNSYYIRNIKIAKNQFSPLKADQGRQKREVSLSATGNYSALERYLNYLENMPAPLVIHTLSITKSGSDPDVLNLEISGDIYGAN